MKQILRLGIHLNRLRGCTGLGIDPKHRYIVSCEPEGRFFIGGHHDPGQQRTISAHPRTEIRFENRFKVTARKINQDPCAFPALF